MSILINIQRGENSPKPCLLSLKKKRIVIVFEPEDGCKLNKGFIKFMTGNDIPDIENIDNAFSDRLRCINFPTKFVIDPTLKHHKKLDDKLQSKILKWGNDFILVLLEYYRKFTSENLKPSKNVSIWTENYKEEVDKYLIFLNERTEECDTHISNVDLYNDFKYWYRNKYPDGKIPNNRDFSAGIKKHKNIDKSVKINGKTTSGIKNLKLRDDDDD